MPQFEKKFAINVSTKDFYPKFIKNSYNSVVKRQTS